MPTLSITITTPHSFDFTAAEHLKRDLTQAARWYGIEPNPVHPDYALSPGQILFGRDWLADGSQVLTWALQRVDAVTLRRVGASLERTWRRQVRNHCGDEAVVEVGGLVVAPAAERVAA